MPTDGRQQVTGAARAVVPLLAMRFARREAADECTPRLALARPQVRTGDEAEEPRRSVAGSWVAW